MEYTITLTEQEMLVLNDLLLEAPYKVAAPMINKINAQITKSDEANINN